VAQLVDRIVLTDTYSWMTPVEGVPGRWQHNSARRGDSISVSAEEAKRGEALGGLGDSADLAVTAAAAAEPATAPDEQLQGYTVEELIAYVGERPSEAERVRALEAAREKPRKTVAEAMERVIRARDEELARRAEEDEAARAADAEAAARAAATGAPTVPAGAPRLP
jgi:hypothetical protein